MAVIRLDELNQAHTPFCARMLRAVLAAQEPDGGWGDPLMTGICVRALLCGHGDGPAVDRGIQYLVNLQKPEGLWPREPLRRLPADPFTSAFILFQLVDDERFQRSVRVRQAVRWFQRHAGELDAETARLWKSVVIRTSAARAWHDAQVWS